MSSKSNSPTTSLQLYPNEPDCTDEALKTFIPLKSCSYSLEDLGSSPNEFMECDCIENILTDDDGERFNVSCGEDSDCINRLTLIECVNGLCESTCGKNCENQRFQRRQYADIMVFKTKMKGFGVLAKADIEPHDFIYEYIGEVIDEDEFRDRMITYDEERIKHFYFMMLQTGQFIDATKKGSLARFCNHSCNPNAYVNKWVVNGKLKMGIFASRKILKNEEITFDYNVDRYGAVAQKCFCGEPNCIGFLGGKTQTDSASLLPQSFADALGVNSSVEKKWIKEHKAKGDKIVKNNEENINIEFVESLETIPCEDASDITKIMGVLLQIENKIIALKIFQRLFPISEDILLHQVIKLHGYKCFYNLLKLFKDDEIIISDILAFLEKLPKTTKNGITISHLDEAVNKILEKFPNLKYQCDTLLSKWNKYETYMRISKREPVSDGSKMSSGSYKSLADLRRVRLPPGWEIIQENGRPVYYNATLQKKLNNPPSVNEEKNDSRNEFYYQEKPRLSRYNNSDRFNGHDSLKRSRSQESDYNMKSNKVSRQQSEESMLLERSKEEEERRLKLKREEDLKKAELNSIIEEANKQRLIEQQEKEKAEREEQERRQRQKSMSRVLHIEHKWNRFFASFVPNIVRKYQSDITLSHENMKECAKEITKVLSSKEMKRDSKALPPNEPSKEKRAKVKKFVDAYMEKFIYKYKQRRQR